MKEARLRPVCVMKNNELVVQRILGCIVLGQSVRVTRFIKKQWEYCKRTGIVNALVFYSSG